MWDRNHRFFSPPPPRPPPPPTHCCIDVAFLFFVFCRRGVAMRSATSYGNIGAESGDILTISCDHPPRGISVSERLQGVNIRAPFIQRLLEVNTGDPLFIVCVMRRDWPTLRLQSDAGQMDGHRRRGSNGPLIGTADVQSNFMHAKRLHYLPSESGAQPWL